MGPEVTTAHGINNSGEIVGVFVLSGSAIQQAFSYNGTKFLTINVPGHSNTGAHGVNNRGEIVGFTDNGAVGFADRNGEFDLIMIPNAQSTIANGVNDRGLVVGSYSDGVVTLGFVATPVPGQRN